MRKFFILLLLFLFSPSMLVFAEDALSTISKPKIHDINVTGLKMLKKQEFLSFLPFAIGDEYSKQNMLNSLRPLFNSGSFLNATVSYRETPDNNIIIMYSVEERPWITDLEFRGNDNVSTSTLKSKITTADKSFLNNITLKKDIEAILNQYMIEGFIGTQVDISQEDVKNGNKKVIFSIAEGSKLSVKNINVYGTQTLSPIYLKSDFMTLKEPFLFNLMKYPLIPQALEIEGTKMTQLAYNKGFMDFKVIRTKLDAYVSYKPSLDHMTRKLRDFNFSNLSIQNYRKTFAIAFEKKNKNQISNLLDDIRNEAKKSNTAKPNSININDLEVFLKGLEVASNALLDIHQILVKKLPSQITLDVFFTEKSSSGYEVSFYTKEGKPYLFLGVDILGSTRVDPEFLKSKFLKIFPGSTYNSKMMQDFKNSISQYFRDQGYFGIVVKDTTSIDSKRQTIRHKYIIQEGQKMHINRMYIQGNEKTKNFVVDRELRIKEGDTFSQSKIATSQRLLQRTGYFENIDIIPSAGPEENLLDLTWKLKEQRTGNLQIGGGYGTETGISVFGSIAESNFLGYGINASGKVSFGQYERGVQFRFASNYVDYLPVGWSISTGYDWIRQQASPRYDRDGDGIWDKIVKKEDGKYYLLKKGDEDFGYYFDENRSGSFKINPGDINPDGSLNYAPGPADDIYSNDRYFDRQILFLDLGAGYSFADFWSVNIVHSSLISKYENPHNIDVNNLLVDEYYSLKDDLLSQKWSYTSHIDLGISFNNTNSPLSPTEGISTRFTMAFFGVEGGYDKFLRLDASFAGYVPLLTLPKEDFKMVWASGIRLSVINELFGPVKLHYENQIGFNTMEEVRGWSNYIDDSDLLGLGKISFGTELRASIPYTNSLLWLVAFFDGGNISDRVSTLPYNFEKFLYSTGFGIRLDFPSFPVRFYLAQRLKWDEYFFKTTGGLNFEFSISSAF